MSDTREKIAKSMWEYDNPQDKNAIKIKFEDYPKSLDFIQEYYTKADAILSLVREAVSAVKYEVYPEDDASVAVSEYQDKILKVLS